MNPKKAVRAVFRLLTTNIRLACGKFVHGRRLHWNPVTCLALSDNVEMAGGSSIDFGRGLRTRGRCLFNCQEEGFLSIGRDVFLNSGCQFNCHKSVIVGDGCEFGPNVLIYDHDHDYRGGMLKDGHFLYGEVKIGHDCWIGANTVILRGTEIGDRSVIAAGSVIKGKFPADSLIFQKRKTEVCDCSTRGGINGQ